LLDDLLHGQAVDPSIEDPGAMPPPIAGASRLNVNGHQRLKTRARSDLGAPATECSGRAGALAARSSINSMARSVAAAEARSFRCGSPFAIAWPKASSWALYSSPRR